MLTPFYSLFLECVPLRCDFYLGNICVVDRHIIELSSPRESWYFTWSMGCLCALAVSFFLFIEVAGSLVGLEAHVEKFRGIFQ